MHMKPFLVKQDVIMYNIRNSTKEPILTSIVIRAITSTPQNQAIYSKRNALEKTEELDNSHYYYWSEWTRNMSTGLRSVAN